MPNKAKLVTQILELEELDIIEIVKEISISISADGLKALDKYFTRKTTKRKKLTSTTNEPAVKSDNNEPRKAINCSIYQIADKSFSKAAWKCPLIFRGDHVPDHGKLFIDVEKVSLKIRPGNSKHETVAATIAVVNENKTLILWAYIKWPQRSVCQYFTSLTNLERGSLDIGIPLYFVHKLLDMCLDGNLLIGQDIKNDLRSLRYTYNNVEDLKEFFVDKNNQAYGLKALAAKYLNKPNVQEQEHSAIIDARLTKDLYTVKERMISDKTNSNYEFDIARPIRAPYVCDPGDRCFCNIRRN